MRRFSFLSALLRCSVLLLVLFSTMSCEHKDLCFRHPHDALVRVDVDWSQFHEETPTGMSVMVYPEDPEMQCRTVLSNEISYATMALPAGRYKTLGYNQSPSEFGSVHFGDMDQFYKAVVKGNKMSSRWYVTRAEDEIVIMQPEWIACDSQTDVVVTDEMVQATDEMKLQQAMQTKQGRTRYESAFPISNLVPLNIISTLNVKVYAKGIHNLRSARASVSGFADGCMLATRQYTTTTATHLMEKWSVTVDPADPTQGYIFGSISCFGLPADHQGLAEENNFILDVLLVDNKTILQFPFQVGDAFVKQTGTDETHELTINLEIYLDSPLPDVKPEGGSGSGFDATVDDWGPEENVDINM